MKIPSKLKIGGHNFKIIITKLEGLDCGETNYNTNTIKIDSDLCQSQREATFWHELFHAMNTQLGASEMGHIILESLAEQIHQVVEDNKLMK